MKSDEPSVTPDANKNAKQTMLVYVPLIVPPALLLAANWHFTNAAGQGAFGPSDPVWFIGLTVLWLFASQVAAGYTLFVIRSARKQTLAWIALYTIVAVVLNLNTVVEIFGVM